MGLAVFLLGVGLYSGVWQPAQQRLDKAEAVYRQRVALATEVQQVQPRRILEVADAQPLSTRLSETAAAAGLDMQQLDQDGQVVRVAISGDAATLFGWLYRIEQGGAVIQSLTVEKREKALEARVVWGAS
jgi:general secretion pathway protein M